MRPKHNKHPMRWAAETKPAHNRQKLDSRITESAVVEQCPGILKTLSPTLSCSHYSRKSRDKPNSQKRIKRPFYDRGLKAASSPGISRKLVTYEEIHEKKDEGKLNNRRSRSKSEIVGYDYFTDQLDVDYSGSDQELEFKQTKHLKYVPQRDNTFNKQATITSPSSATSTPISLRSDMKSDMNLFNRIKYVKDLVEDQRLLVNKVIHLKRELNVIVKKMAEVKGQGLLTGSTSAEIMKHGQCRHGARESVCSSNNCLQYVRLGDNKSRQLSSPTLNISEASNSIHCPDGSSGDTPTDCRRKLTVLTGHNSRQHTISLPHNISQTTESTSEMCSSTEQSVSCVFRLVQYVFLIVLVIAQCVVQFVTMST